MVQEFGFKHISLGDILREEVKQGTPVGKECSKIMKEGKLVPVNLTLELMKKAMSESKDAGGYILDGFPRATSQARAFQKQVHSNPFSTTKLPSLETECPHSILWVFFSHTNSVFLSLHKGRDQAMVQKCRKFWCTMRREHVEVSKSEVIISNKFEETLAINSLLLRCNDMVFKPWVRVQGDSCVRI